MSPHITTRVESGMVSRGESAKEAWDQGRVGEGGAWSGVGSAGMARGIRDRVGWGVGWSGVGWRR